ncbi:hypothetical protein [Nitriliruptor alkaliphilus]|uniref:hypothetical protein n=1 Tax=Nitriliruptor alkaliphilus TaxID=427918 RepID=UPI0006985663|nr:hypothetical protein [Nitriliruptor alkaliphilus]
MGRTIAADSEGLARSGAAEEAVARHHRDALIAAAVTLVVSAGHDPDRAACDEAACGLADPGLCDVAHRLARLPDAPTVVPATHVALASARFAAALTSSADAIRHCRQTVHIGRGCWFSADADLDGCGEVLRLLHRLG